MFEEDRRPAVIIVSIQDRQIQLLDLRSVCVDMFTHRTAILSHNCDSRLASQYARIGP
jgi:hypothetical protein